MKIKLNKSLKTTLFTISFLFLLPVSLLTGCKSSSSLIPGEQTILLKNLYIEYAKLGDAYIAIEKYSDAINFYKKAMEEKELYWPCFYKVAKCYVYNSDWNHALEMYEKLLEKDPDNSSLKASIAYIYSMSGQYIKALDIYKELLILQPNNEKFIENYLAIMLGNEDIFKENRTNFEDKFQFFKDNFTKNSNITTFQKKYDEYVEKLDGKKKDEKSADVSNSDSTTIENTPKDNK